MQAVEHTAGKEYWDLDWKTAPRKRMIKCQFKTILCSETAASQITSTLCHHLCKNLQHGIIK